ncbi:tumor necrosis factor (ligand) superfamily, member 10 like 4 isoform X1 [Clupea harengus]|uniref:Tumor necrosis factor (Ligand) superfamily, member 10 like 4 isoform X1 n=1 Tax=Clupea harengus TaxID=7950 RepID=A0A8M1KFG2_CLUHA|nr:tumor necrosis factor (ligand) superfamily, member 10 like 4 isoform X1 [Clupea harengus]
MTSDAQIHNNYSELKRVPKLNQKDCATKWNAFLLTLSFILGAETFISACLLHGLFQDISKAQEEVKYGEYPVECLYKFLDSNTQTHHQIDLQTCDLLIQELGNGAHRRLQWDIKNTIFESLAECNISQEYLPAIHVGAETELRQFNHLPTGDGANKMTSAHRLQWNNIDGQVTEDGLMRLTPDGETVVPQDGLYFVYSQVYFQLTPSRPPGRNFSFFQTIYKRTTTHSQPIPLAKARERLCLNPTFNTQLFSSHQGALFHLHKGDKLSLSVWDMSAVRLLQDSTYFGAFMVK